MEAVREREKREYDAALAARAEQLRREQREREDVSRAGVEEQRRHVAHEKPPAPTPRKPLRKPRPAPIAQPAAPPTMPQAAGGGDGPSVNAPPQSDAAHVASMRHSECCVCLTDVPLPQLLALVRCGHRCVCTSCVDTVLASRKCPKCRALVEHALVVYED